MPAFDADSAGCGAGQLSLPCAQLVGAEVPSATSLGGTSPFYAPVVELVDTAALGAAVRAGHVGSNPTGCIFLVYVHICTTRNIL